ncbi:Gibberellin 20 oxidase 5 [Clarias magur]|uniref:Gibberellin 20 oxidase 5 n=1 Tax=Clarias magur TaxID=1594786 RepID=A0A8J4XAS9_CLAMG|nr:Gibberellin 20 oxidase 5 [Clarias magur]
MESLANGGVKASEEQMEEEEAKFWHKKNLVFSCPYYLPCSEPEDCLKPTVEQGGGCCMPKIIGSDTVIPESIDAIFLLPTSMGNWSDALHATLTSN